MTDKQNLEVMKSFGLNISLRTLKYFKEYAGLTKNRNTEKTIIENNEYNIDYNDYNLNHIFKNHSDNILKNLL